MKDISSFERAVARVKRIKGFYNHLFIYIIFLVLWLLFAIRICDFVDGALYSSNKDFFDWVNVNLWLNPLIWGIIVLVHGLYVLGYKFSFFRNWEARKIQEYMNEEIPKTNDQYE